MIEGAVPPTYSVTWQEFDSMILWLASKLRETQPAPDYIVGIARGGCVPAVALSHLQPGSEFAVIRARIHNSDAIRARKTAVAVERMMLPSDIRGRRVLLVDDVLHTGTTARACYEFLQGMGPQSVEFMALLRDTYDVQDELLLPFTPITTKSVNAWVVFPWEDVSR